MKPSLLFISLLFFSSLLFAQTSGARVQVSEENMGERTTQVRLDITLTEALPIGFALELPAGSMAALSEVQIGNETLWLKKEINIPTAANSLHWTEQDNQILLLFSANTLSSGKNIRLSIQVFKQTSTLDSPELRLNRIEASANQTYRIGAEFSRVQIFQTNNNETR